MAIVHAPDLWETLRTSSAAAATHARVLFLLLCPLMVGGAGAAWAGETSAGEVYTEGVRAFERGDYASALQLWKPLAERGDARAQLGLGMIYASGIGDTPPVREEALRWYRDAARQGIPAAQNQLALMYAEGVVVDRDLARAVTLWRQAAEAGYAPAQLNLAVALEGGAGVERNPHEAAIWYQRAEDRGLTGARSGGVADLLESPEVEPSEGLSRERPDGVSGAEGRARSTPSSLPDLPAAPSASGDFYVQLVSLRDHRAAVQAGRELSSRHADLLADWEATVRTVDLGPKGVWHRVLFGPLPSRASAKELCSSIQARAAECLVAPGNHE